MSSVLSPAYRDHPTCQAFEDLKHELLCRWPERTDRTALGETTLRLQMDAELIRITRQRDESLARDGLYVAEKFGENGEWIVELLPREDAEPAGLPVQTGGH